MLKQKTILVIGLMAAAVACTPTTQEDNKNKMALSYPETTQVETVDTLFGTPVSDPYRWLEDDRSDETGAWVKAQNKVTFNYLEQIPYRDTLKNRLTKLWNYEKVGAPTRHGGYFYFSKNNGLQNQYVVYRYPVNGTTEEAEVFLDPNTFSKEGTTSLAGLSFTKDGSMAAYQISEGGSDWRKVIVIDAETKEQIEDTLVDVKFSGVSWYKNEGFYYSSYEKPEEGSQLSGVTNQHKLYYHKIGEKQANDALIFGGSETPRRYVYAGVTEDEQFLIISAAESTTGNELYLKQLGKENAPIQPLLKGFGADASVIHSQGQRLFIKTNLNAPNGKVVVATLDKPQSENWQELIPETENVLTASAAGGKIFTTYMIDATEKVFQYNLKGEQERQIQLPGLGSAKGFAGRTEDTLLYYSFTNYVYPTTIFKYNIETGESELFNRPAIDFKSEDYESKQVFYRSKDGTKVPMIITHKKGIELNGKNPTLLYGYGGFNISLTPDFSTSNVVFLQQGGIYAVANLRGGGEYGEEWHQAGTKMNKQNVFDDFIAAAEYLIDNQYTSSEKLGIAGGSNGGLLVGATITQRPNLMAVALPAVGVLDMLRYHKFTAGAGWHTDYGTADDSEEMFKYLYEYSPVHNTQAGTTYPATMVMTGDHDDRVVPAHSFKFAAALQRDHEGEEPVLIRINTKAGHGAGKPTAMIIEEQADKWAFMLWNTGFEQLPKS